MQVYRIFNRVNSKSYIGVTRWKFKDRYPQGKWWKWTHSIHLKSAVEKYGLENFEWEILKETDDLNELYELEKFYINSFRSLIPNGYNLILAAGNPNPSHTKEYELIDYDGNVYRVRNLSSFCRSRKINYGAMLNLVSGISKSSQGFCLSTTDFHEIDRKSHQTFTLRNKTTGELISVNPANRREVRSKLNIPSWKPLISGKIHESGGWHLTTTPSNKLRQNREIVVDYNGERIIIKSIPAFCKEANLDKSSFYKLLNGKIKAYRGYSIYKEKS